MKQGYSSISGVFLLIFLILGICFGCLGLGAAYQEESFTLSELVNGKAAIKFEKTYNADLPIYQPSLALWSSLNYTAFKEGNKGVLIGSDGWLFTDEEFSTDANAQKSIEEKFDYITSVKGVLAEKNVDVLVVIIPMKSRIYEEKLGRYKLPDYKAQIYNETVNNLEQRGIPICDLRPSLHEAKEVSNIFFKTDTHWTPLGASRAAGEIKRCAESSYGSLNFKKTEFNLTLRENSSSLQGDLTRYLPFGSFQSFFPFGEESYFPDAVTETTSANIDANALFSEDAPEITVVGTSYSANENWGFVDYLQYNFGSKILNAAEQGMGPFETMKKYLENGAYKTTPPKMVIWEIPERYLTMPFNPNNKEV